MEVLLIGLAARGQLQTQAIAPYCEQTGTWMEPKRVDLFAPGHEASVRQALVSGDPTPLAALPDRLDDGSVRITWYQAPVRADSDADIVVLERVSMNRKKEQSIQRLSATRMPLFLADRFMATLAARAATPPA